MAETSVKNTHVHIFFGSLLSKCNEEEDADAKLPLPRSQMLIDIPGTGGLVFSFRRQS